MLAWGGSFVAARHLLNPASPGRTPLDPLILAAARFAIASLIFAVPFVTAIVRRRIGARDLLRMAVLGQVAFSTYFWLQYIGVRNTNAGIASILVVGLFPSATTLLAPLGGEKRPPLPAWGALLIGFLGVGVVVLGKPVEVSTSSTFLVGALCLVANAFAFAVYSLLSRRWMAGVPPLIMTAGTMTFGTAGLAVLGLIVSPRGWSALGRLDGSGWAALLYLALICSAAAYFAWNFALSRVGAPRASVWIYAEPVVAVSLGAAILGERPGWAAFAGSAAIAISVLWATRARVPG